MGNAVIGLKVNTLQRSSTGRVVIYSIVCEQQLMSLSKHDGHVDNGGWEWGA